MRRLVCTPRVPCFCCGPFHATLQVQEGKDFTALRFFLWNVDAVWVALCVYFLPLWVMGETTTRQDGMVCLSVPCICNPSAVTPLSQNEIMCICAHGTVWAICFQFLAYHFAYHGVKACIGLCRGYRMLSNRVNLKELCLCATAAQIK